LTVGLLILTFFSFFSRENPDERLPKSKNGFKMQKMRIFKWAFGGILLVVAGFLIFSHREVVAPTPQVSDSQNFRQKIKFADGSGISSDDEVVFYTDPSSRESKILKFSVRDFLEKNKENSVVADEIIEKLSKMNRVRGIRELPDSEKPGKLQFHDKLHLSATEFFRDLEKLQSELGNIEDLPEDDIREAEFFEKIQKLSYLLDLSGEYAVATDLREKNCKKFKIDCNFSVSTKVFGQVLDEEKNPIGNVRVQVLNFPEVFATTSDDGKYELEVRTTNFQKIRLRASQTGFSDDFAEFYVLGDASGQVRELNFELRPAQAAIILNLDEKSISNTNFNGEFDIFGEVDDENFTLKTPRRQFKIPFGSIVDSNGQPASGVATAYIFEFENLPSGWISADRFAENRAEFAIPDEKFSGWQISIFSEKNEELFVKKSHPGSVIDTENSGENKKMWTMNRGRGVLELAPPFQNLYFSD